MKDEKKTKKQLIDELITLRRRIAELQSLGPERRQAEEVLRENEEKFRQLVETSPDAIFVHSDRKFVFVNPATVKLFGAANPGELIGRPIRDIIHPEYWKIIEKRDQQIEQKGKKAPLIEEKLLCLDGTTIYVEAAAVTFTYQGKSAVQVVLRDITERKQAEEELKKHRDRLEKQIEERKLAETALLESKERLKVIFDAAENVSFIMTDLAGTEAHILEFSPGAERIFGYRHEEILGKRVAILHLPEDVAKFPKIIKSMRQKKEGFTGETILVRKTGEKFPALFTTYPIFDAKGNMIATLGVSIDVTERKRAEEALQESEERYRVLVESSNQAIFTVDKSGLFLFMNVSAARQLGGEPKDFRGKTMGDLFPKEIANRQMAAIRKAMETASQSIIESESFIKGEQRWFETNIRPTRNSSGVFDKVLCVAADITERKRSEEALWESEERLSQIVQGSLIPTFVIDNKHVITHWNKVCEKLTGISADEIIGTQKQWRAFYSAQRPIMADLIVDNLSEEEIAKCYGSKCRKSAHLESAYEVEKFFPNLGERGKWLFFTAAPLRNVKGKVVGAIETLQDITERKRAEEKIKASLQEKEVLLREIHHRVKNNLQVISSLINFQTADIRDKTDLMVFKELQNRIRSMSLVHEKLYQSKDLAHVNFRDYIQDLVKALYRAHTVDKGKIKLKTAVKNVSLGIDIAIPCGLIINELVSNALKHAFPEGQEGKIKISLRPINKSEVELMVSDNGVGLPEGLDFRKTGPLGLHIVTILAEDQLHGKVEVDRTKGTKFKIRLRVD